ncbi:MAG: zinc ribbon domain-containing protein [Xenococcaceae cyanobacterium]
MVVVGASRAVRHRWFPSSKLCSNCGWRHPDLKLSDRLFSCQQCNLSIDRDWNASLNLSR